MSGTFKNALSALFGGFWAGVEHLLGSILPAIKDGADAFMATFAKDALIFVQTANSSLPGSTGAQKKAWVFEQLIAAVEDAGWTAATALVNSLIESSVVAVKAKDGQTLATPPAAP